MIAVAVRVLFEVGLMFVVGWIELLDTHDASLDSWHGVPDLFSSDKLLQLTRHSFSYLCLLFAVAEDDRCILSSNIIPLSVQGRRIVKLVEETNQILKMLLRLVQFDVEHLDVAR